MPHEILQPSSIQRHQSITARKICPSGGQLNGGNAGGDPQLHGGKRYYLDLERVHAQTRPALL